MQQFINGSDSQYESLQDRVRHEMVAFSDQAMPTGTAPDRARIGFRIHPERGTTVLFVDRARSYSHQLEHPRVAEWLLEGQVSFDSFAECIAWIRGDLARAYVVEGAESLTDLDAVAKALEEGRGPARIDSETLFAALSRDVLGQDSALKLLAESVSRHCARVDPSRPLTLFAVGPTGVGKTRAAEILASVLSEQGTGYSYLRLDMSEYQESHRVSNLLGAPAGYVGYGDGAELPDRLHANPRTIVHFDEIEKAHSQILLAIMNALDAGRLSRPAGSKGAESTVDCRRAIFYFTSNIDAQGILADLSEEGALDDPSLVDKVCRRRLMDANIKPELVGRIGCFLVFGALPGEIRARIAALTIRRIAAEYGLTLVRIVPEAVVQLMRDAGDGSFGVRPLEYAADRLFGSSFDKAASRKMEEPVALLGPPWRINHLRGEAVSVTGEDHK